MGRFVRNPLYTLRAEAKPEVKAKKAAKAMTEAMTEAKVMTEAGRGTRDNQE
jgi:hypothetical protein